MRYRFGARAARARAAGARTSVGLSMLMSMAVVPAAPQPPTQPLLEVALWVTDEAGSPLSGTRISVSALPMGGPERPRLHTERRLASSDAHGRATLAIALTPYERESASLNGGWINLEAMILDRTGLPTGFAAFSRYVGANPGAGPRVAAGAGREVRVVARRDVARAAAAALGRPVSKPVRSVRAVQAVGCWNYHWEVYRYEANWTKVGELNSASDTLVARFTYGRSADSNIDTAFRAGLGSWTVDGRIHIGNTQSLAAGINGRSNYHWGMITKFDYALLFLYADCPGQSHKYMSQQRVEPVGWKGGAVLNSIIVDQPPRTNPSWSEWFPPGGEWHRSDGKFSSWGAATSAFGAGLGAQSGASEHVSLDYEFGTGRARHWLYGSNAHISTAGRVFASDS
jgi:hypothetical protein